MKSKLGAVIIVLILLCGLGSCMDSCSGPSQYEQDLNNGMDKFSKGDYDGMTDGEKNAVGNFLEWQQDQ